MNECMNGVTKSLILNFNDSCCKLRGSGTQIPGPVNPGIGDNVLNKVWKTFFQRGGLGRGLVVFVSGRWHLHRGWLHRTRRGKFYWSRRGLFDLLLGWLVWNTHFDFPSGIDKQNIYLIDLGIPP